MKQSKEIAKEARLERDNNDPNICKELRELVAPVDAYYVRAGRIFEVQEIIEWMESVTIDERLLLIMRDRLIELEKS